MKRVIRYLSLFMLVLFGAVMLSSAVFAKEEINLQLKKKAESIVLQWNGEKNETYSVYRREGKGKFTVIDKIKGKKYTDKSVEGGQKYTYCIKLTKKKSVKSAHKTAVYLPAPKMKSAKLGNVGITVRWKSAAGAESYAVYRKTDGGKVVRIGTAYTESFTDKNTVKGTAYTYTVKSMKGTAKSVASSCRAGIFTSPVLSKLERGASGLVLSWEKTEGAESYVIYRMEFGGKKWTKLATVSAGALSYEDKSAADGVKYSYLVKAKAANFSSLNEGKTLSELCIKAPAGLKIKKNGKKLVLSWQKKDTALSYEIYKKEGDGKWKKLTSTKEISYTDTVKSTAKLYSYKIKAVTVKGESGFSSVVTSRCVDPSKPMVALTYDDGPHPVNTNRILDALEKNGARATFFVVGSRITEYKSCLKRQAELGCEIANHSYSHASLGYNSNEKILDEVTRTDKLIEKYSGQKPTLVRAPGGSIGKGPTVTGKPFIQWSVDTMDWDTLSSSYVVNHIKRTVRDGSIILMHDLYGSTAAASEIIIPWLISRGYQLVTVTELLEARGTEIQGGKVYYNGYA